MRGYQRVATTDDGAGVPSESLNGDIPLQDRAAFESVPASPLPPFSSIQDGRKASVYRLLPFFFLSSLSWGITMVPRVNVLVSLICQQMVDNGTLGSATLPRHEMDMGAVSGDQPGPDSSTGSHNSSSPGSNVCSGPQVLAGVAFLSTYRDLITGILGAVMSFYLGKLSDRIGRVKVMALNGHGLLAGELALLLVVAFPRAIDYRWLFLSFAIDGLSGSFPLLMASTASYVTDTTTDHDRIVAMGWLQSGMFLGMALGPALGTALSQLTPDRPAAIFLWAIICHIVGLLCLLLLPESLNERDHSTHNHRDHHHMCLDQARGHDHGHDHGHSHGHFAPSPGQSLGSFLRSTLSLAAVDALFDPSSDRAAVRRHRRNLVLLLAVTAIMFGCSVGSMDVLMLYPQAQFQWNMMTTGNFISIVNICRTVSSTLFLRLFMSFFTGRFRGAFANKASLDSPNGPPGTRTAEDAQAAQLPLLRLALFSDLLGYIGFGLAPSSFFFTAAGVLSSLSALGVSASQAAMTMLVSPEHVGKLMGTVGSAQALTRLVAPPAVNLVYGWTVSMLPQAVFFGLAAATGTGVVMTYLLRM